MEWEVVWVTEVMGVTEVMVPQAVMDRMVVDTDLMGIHHTAADNSEVLVEMSKTGLFFFE